jgi:protein involved in polysaccharide export with SLBB domain
MNKLLLTLFLIPVLAINSQELDSAYLDSLPDGIREDVLGRVDDRQQSEKPVYKRPSTMIKKNYCEDQTEVNFKTDDIDIDNEDYYINKNTSYSLLEDKNKNCIIKSNRFGSNFFDKMQTSFMPINEPNLDSSYILDFGDSLQLQLIGQKSSIEELSISRDGSISVPEIGKIFLAGISLNDANIIIKNKYANSYIGVEAYLTLTNIRDIQVLLTGNAYSPGIYTLNGNSNILHALSMAGGIDEMGSYRKVDLLRNNEVIRSIDLYDIFIYGKSGFGERLRTGDTILVNPAFDLITVSGAVKRPAVYELKPTETYLDLFNFSSGFSDSADQGSMRIERMEGENVSYINVNNKDALSTIKPKSSDNFHVGEFVRKQVTISGAVKTPGIYTISRGATLSSIIKKANGYKDEAYPFGGILNNEKTFELNKKAVDSLYNSFIKKLVTKGDPLFASESLPFALRELKKSNPSGRVIAEFDLNMINANPDLDTTLDDGDEIIIPIKTQQVYIFGEVNNNGAIRYLPNNRLDDYLLRSGGVTDSADLSFIYVVHPNGEVNKLRNNKLSFLNNRSNDILIYPGSVIFVPRKVNSREAAMTAAIWAPILSAMATSITALSVLDRN